MQVRARHTFSLINELVINRIAFSVLLRLYDVVLYFRSKGFGIIFYINVADGVIVLNSKVKLLCHDLLKGGAELIGNRYLIIGDRFFIFVFFVQPCSLKGIRRFIEIIGAVIFQPLCVCFVKMPIFIPRLIAQQTGASYIGASCRKGIIVVYGKAAVAEGFICGTYNATYLASRNDRLTVCLKERCFFVLFLFPLLNTVSVLQSGISGRAMGVAFVREQCITPEILPLQLSLSLLL